eukprot:jgi/Botrbrau1/9156/Bobra.160_3s0028.1
MSLLKPWKAISSPVPVPIPPLDWLTATQLARLCSALQVKDLQAVQDVLNCLVLSEVAYRVLDQGPAQVPRILTERKQQFPAGLITLQAVQCSLPHVQHRYLLASSPSALYVAFMGTKEARDLLADANILQGALWEDPSASSIPPGAPAAHRGFLMRARSVPIEQLSLRARSQGKRLILCGHSLGGAVAELCMLRLLRKLPAEEVAGGHAECFCFGTPALGNAALAALVRRSGWDRFFYSMTLPEDYVARILARYRPGQEEVQLEAREEAGEAAAMVASSSGAGGLGAPSQGTPLVSISHQPFTAEGSSSEDTPGGTSSEGAPDTASDRFAGTAGSRDSTAGLRDSTAGLRDSTAGPDELSSNGAAAFGPALDDFSIDEVGGPGEPGGTGRQEGIAGGAWGISLPSLPPASPALGSLWERLRGLGSSVSSRFSLPLAALPSYVHFGRHHVAPMPGPHPPGLKLPETVPGQQTYISFASHSMGSYRNRILLLLAGIGPLPWPRDPAADTPVVNGDNLAPPLQPVSALSWLPPLPPPRPVPRYPQIRPRLAPASPGAGIVPPRGRRKLPSPP